MDCSHKHRTAMKSCHSIFNVALHYLRPYYDRCNISTFTATPSDGSSQEIEPRDMVTILCFEASGLMIHKLGSVEEDVGRERRDVGLFCDLIGCN